MSKSNDNEENHLVQAITRLLRPLVRFLLSRGFTYTRLIQIVRPLYVEVAETAHGEQTGNRVLTDSRISLMTGIARRYVKELRQSSPPVAIEMLKSPPGTRLIAEWITNPKYLSNKGQPLPLPKLERAGNQPSFEALALSITTDVRSRTLLDDLVSKGIVEVNSTGHVVLRSVAYKPDKNRAELIDYFGVHLHDHMAAATNNLYGNSSPMFERSAFMDKLSEESIEELNEFVDEKGMDLLKSTYAYAAELSKKEAGSVAATRRFRLGIYGYHEDEKKKGVEI